jgi:choline dehydrogenase-like flavoprotein
VLIDLNLARRGRFAADICVIGTGAAGLTLASVLLHSGASVIMLESGGFDHEDDVQRLNRCETDRLLFEGAFRGRTRGFGGSTTCWGGQLLPLEPLDFARRDWVEHSGWPITHGEMDPYYRRALSFAGSDGLNFDSDVCVALGRENPFDPQVVRYYFSKWSPHPRFGDVMADALRASERVRVFLHATATRLQLDGAGRRVAAVHARNGSLDEYVFSAPIVVLATGGIETARLLLANRDQARGGIGNANGIVGRFFQDHPSLLVGTVRAENPEQMRRHFATAAVGGLQVTPRVSLQPAVQQADRSLNASAYVGFDYPRMLLRRAMVLNLARAVGVEQRGARNLVDAARLLAGPTVHLHRQGRRIGTDAQFTVTVVTEQEPCAESRITLSRRTDRFGLPLARISWHTTAKTWDTVRRFSRALVREFDRAGLGRLDLAPHITADRAYWRVFPHDLYHHMGATRMGVSPATGVVDENCRVFGLENLFIASSSVFPTGGHSNCTLTIMALALRLADHLSDRCAPASTDGSCPPSAVHLLHGHRAAAGKPRSDEQ